MKNKKRLIFYGVLICCIFLLVGLICINNDNQKKYQHFTVASIAVTKKEKILGNCETVSFTQKHRLAGYQFCLKLKTDKEITLSADNFYLLEGYKKPSNQFENLIVNNQKEKGLVKLHKGINTLSGDTQKDPTYDGPLFLVIKTRSGDLTYKNYIFKNNF